MAKIDLEKVLIALLDSPFNKQFDDKIKDALKEQGLEYKDGKIVQMSKFKVGDWVVFNYFPTEMPLSKIIKIENGIAEVRDPKGMIVQTEEPLLYLNYHHWTIQDAKPGDVLACNTNIFIYQKLDEYDIVKSFCDYHKQYGFNGIKDSVAYRNECKPANKEQRDLLFQKMHEAGYEWDADKLELKKIRKPLYKVGNIIEYKGYYYCIKEIVKGGRIGFYYDVVAIDGGKVSSIHSTGEKDIILMSNNFFDYEHANIQQKDFVPKATTANRQLYNQAILKILSDYVEKYPDIRFGQMLCNLDVNPHFDQESRETYWNLNETINKQNHE